MLKLSIELIKDQFFINNLHINSNNIKNQF